ncbi:hypothetical protein BKA83DRAFT_4125407 [Pisolithus microcarpus]|nr:hypothetical protein BKA83DRAFT_4125407 [Pisolithus microcarpus]
MLLYQTVPVPLTLLPIPIPTKKPIEALSNDKTQESFVKPMKERLKNGLTKVSPQSVEVKENLPELHEQLSLRAVEPLESKHIEVLSDMVEKPVKVEDIDRRAKQHERLIKGLRGSAMPTAHNEQANKGQVASDGSSKNIEPHHVEKEQIPMMGVLLKGEQTRSTSSIKTNPQGHMKTSRLLGICTDSSRLQLVSPDKGGVSRGVKSEMAGGDGKYSTMSSDSTAHSRNVSRRQEDEEVYQIPNNVICLAQEGIGMPRNLTIKAWTLQECPDGV